MNINTKNPDSITEADQDFSHIASAETEEFAADEDVIAISRQLIAKNREAYEELAK